MGCDRVRVGSGGFQLRYLLASINLSVKRLIRELKGKQDKTNKQNWISSDASNHWSEMIFLLCLLNKTWYLLFFSKMHIL